MSVIIQFVIVLRGNVKSFFTLPRSTITKYIIIFIVVIIIIIIIIITLLLLCLSKVKFVLQNPYDYFRALIYTSVNFKHHKTFIHVLDRPNNII